MKTGKIYFYLDNTKKENHQEYFTVVEVNQFDNNTDEAERKARTIAMKLNEKLAGGYFNDDCKPQRLARDMSIIAVI